MANFIDLAVKKVEKTKEITFADRDALVNSDDNVIKLARSLLGITAYRDGSVWVALKCTDVSNENLDTVNNWGFSKGRASKTRMADEELALHSAAYAKGDATRAKASAKPKP